MEITNLTFLTLSILIVLSIWFIVWLLTVLSKHDKVEYTTLDKPLKNKNKPWHNK